MKWTMMNSCYGKEKPDNGYFCHKRKGIIVVKSTNISVSFCY